jgi:hypothetical protein
MDLANGVHRANAMKALLVCVAATLAFATTALAFDDSPTLVWNKAIGGFQIGESRDQVNYDYGDDCMAGCPGICQGKGDAHHADTMYCAYRLHGSTVIIGYRKNRLVYIETKSPYYRTAGDVGVGTKIPLGPCTHKVRQYRDYLTGKRKTERYCEYHWRDLISTNRGGSYCVSIWRTYNFKTEVGTKHGRVNYIALGANGGYLPTTGC